MPGKDDEMASSSEGPILDDERSNDGLTSPPLSVKSDLVSPPLVATSPTTPGDQRNNQTDEETENAVDSSELRRMVAAEEDDEPVLASPTTPPPPLPPPAPPMTPPMIVQKSGDILLQRSLDMRSPSPVRISNSISPKAMSPKPCSTPPASEEAPLDFSMKKPSGSSKASCSSRDSNASPGLQSPGPTGDSPLDLSVPRRRKETTGSESHSRHPKVAKMDPTSLLAQQVGALTPWGYAVPKSLPPASKLDSTNPASGSTANTWNGSKSGKSHRSSSSKSSQHQQGSSGLSNYGMHKSGGRPSMSTSPLTQMANAMGLAMDTGSSSSSKPGRQNPWQTQWMSKSGEQAKDVFTCVWCKESFRSLAEMTVHMKQSPRCGMAGMQASIPSCSPSPPVQNPAGASHHGVSMHGGSGSPGVASSSSHGTSTSNSKMQSTSAGAGSGPSSSSSSVLQGVKESMPLPRKLVRGQDVWLGKGAEQTRQILKCMWCGQSFKTLADMTTHMRVTQHYTNIISQEQIISWRTPEDKVAAQSQVNAVLTCKVCDQAFGSLKELSYHMVKNSHYKEHILRSISEGGGRRRQTRERRKKSLPVRKLLELERMEMSKQPTTSEVANSSGAHGSSRSTSGSSSAAALAAIKSEPAIDGKITCEECAEKVDAKDFVRHIKKCSGQRNQQASLLAAKVKTEPPDVSPSRPSPVNASSRSSPDVKTVPKDGRRTTSPGEDSKADKGTENSCDSAESSSVLNAIERLIEKSFEHKGRRGTPSTGILQRLGIDEEVYPPWHPASSPGKMTPGSDAGRAKSTSPMRMGVFDPNDPMSVRNAYEERKMHHHHHPGPYDGFNHAGASGCGSETSRGSTPVSLINTSSPARSLTMSPHRTHSSMTGSTCGSPPPSPHSITPASPAPSVSSVHQKLEANSVTREEVLPTRSPPIDRRRLVERPSPMDQDTDEEDVGIGEGSFRCDSPIAVATPLVKLAPAISPSTSVTPPKLSAVLSADRPSRPSSVSSFEEPPRMRTPVSDSDASLRPASSAEEQPLELVKPPSGASKRKKASRHHHHHQRKNEAHSSRKKMLPSNNKGSSSSGISGNSATDQLGADHPLRELQKLLDKTDAHLSRPPAALQPSTAGPGSILAFSWACNDVAASSDSMMKCAFCETHFISKGAYRHHLSKMHFVKDSAAASGGSAGALAALSESPPITGSNPDKVKNGTDGQTSSKDVSGGSSTNASQPLPSSINDESTHSKFLKYTELAKQLSSKYV